MKYRRFGRTGWQVSEIGYGMWGLGGQWSGSDNAEGLRALHRSVELGCNFFDTAWAYGAGHSERLLSQVITAHTTTKLYVGTKVPPQNMIWPAQPDHKAHQTYPYAHIMDYTKKSQTNLGVATIDLLQLHVWDDGWAADDGWKRAVEELKKAKAIEAFGISVNRWEPTNVLQALQTGLVDAVQVIYNIFDQSPEDRLFPYCRKNDIAVIARVPFDEGTLTGTLTKQTSFPKDDWRSRYFCPENLNPSVDRAERIKKLIPKRRTMPEVALKFILASSTVSTTIPGMRTVAHVESNLAASDRRELPPDLYGGLRKFRWDRQPTDWSA